MSSSTTTSTASTPASGALKSTSTASSNSSAPSPSAGLERDGVTGGFPLGRGETAPIAASPHNLIGGERSVGTPCRRIGEGVPFFLYWAGSVRRSPCQVT